MGTGATTHYYEGNAIRRTGYAADNGVFYLLQDHLRSSSATAAQNGTLAGARNYFYPFGGNRGGAAFNNLTAKRFTGQYHEATLPGGEGLSYYGARWYDAQLGRFTSADSVVPDGTNPQDFNRYSYVRNNPLGYTDPSGHAAVPNKKPGAKTSGGIGGALGQAARTRTVAQPTQPARTKVGGAAKRVARPAQQRATNPWINPDDPIWDLVMTPYWMTPVVLGIVEKVRAHFNPAHQPEPALALTADWYGELGAERRAFGPTHKITQTLMYDEGVGQARMAFLAGGRQDLTDASDNVYHYKFGLYEALRELEQDVFTEYNWSTSFLGGYDVEIRTLAVLQQGTLVQFTVYNETGWESATRLGDNGSAKADAERSEPGPGGTLYQTYTWQELIP